MDVFIEVSLILVIAAVVAFFMQLLRQPLLVGHLLTGVLVGPLVFNLIRSADTIELFSRLGITTLLFLVGLGLSPRVLRQVGRASFLIALGQIFFTALTGFILSAWLGFSFVTSVFLALAFTFSSTIVVTKLLSDRRETEKLHGKLAIGILLIQDFFAALLLVFLSSQASGETIQALFLSLGKGIALVGMVAWFGAWLLPKGAKFFASSQEFLFLAALGWGLGSAALFQFLGFSPEIGALAAGVALAASPYHYEIQAKMRLLRDFFLVLFFVFLGSHISFDGLRASVLPMFVFSIFVVGFSPLIVLFVMGRLGYHKKTSFLTGLSLAQVSEFSFLVVFFGVRLGYVSPSVLSFVTVVGLISIILSTYLYQMSDKLFAFLSPFLSFFELSKTKKDTFRHGKYEAILFGCHRAGNDFLPLLKHSSLSYLVVDFDPTVIDRLAAEHIPYRYGDANDNEFLDEVDVRAARFVVSTLPEFETNAFILAKIRKANPDAVVLLMAHSVEEAMVLYRAGATYVIMPHFLGGNYASLLFEKYGADVRKFATERAKHIQHLSKRLGLAHVSRLGIH